MSNASKLQPIGRNMENYYFLGLQSWFLLGTLVLALLSTLTKLECIFYRLVTSGHAQWIEGAKEFSIASCGDKRQVTALVACSVDGTILPFQARSFFRGRHLNVSQRIEEPIRPSCMVGTLRTCQTIGVLWEPCRSEFGPSMHLML